MDPDEVLRKAAAIIDRDGHNQFGWFAWPHSEHLLAEAVCADPLQEAGRSTPVSAMGAIERAVWGTAMEFALSTPNFDQQYDHCLQAQNYFLRWVRRNCAIWDVSTWNDNRDTTAEDVVRALRQAAQDWPLWNAAAQA
ncbi:hypothetical protein OH768_45220 [Streptomyces sp. NBC_01622]|uniref:DUF6197 family protein n=1 Tax=Streptomyces sp. NBC_01622 TaxID=2975903 RepID=UPI00386495FD|nr:hypothetical protein OH768_45220 [Streptomyces sp. NBC_01622]